MSFVIFCLGCCFLMHPLHLQFPHLSGIRSLLEVQEHIWSSTIRIAVFLPSIRLLLRWLLFNKACSAPAHPQHHIGARVGDSGTNTTSEAALWGV